MSDDDTQDDLLDDPYRDADTVAREGAATTGAAADGELARLPRILRFALTPLAHVKAHILAECRELSPEAFEAGARWAEHLEDKGWRELAGELDRLAVTEDQPILRALADGVRLTSIKVHEVKKNGGDVLRVIAALRAGQHLIAIRRVTPYAVMARIERRILGWTDLLVTDDERFVNLKANANRMAADVGGLLTANIKLEVEELTEARARKASTATEPSIEPSPSVEAVPEGHLLVCPPFDVKSSQKVKDAVRGHEHAVGKPLPLVTMPDLVPVRRALAFEFPYAEAAIDTLLAPLVGRPYVGLPPVIVLGPPGAGKSRLCRRLAQLLGVHIWRTDAARSDGGTFGGTDRRWYSAEPCHPFLACSRGRIANPLVLIDEIEKAATRSDYGRLWDAALGFLEKETASNYPDPCLQVDVDVSRCSFMATANSLSGMPAPLLDRFRVVEWAEPRARDMEALIEPLSLDLLREQGLDERWLQPLAAAELAVLAGRWKGGSVRRLRAYLAVVLRARDRARVLQ